MSEKVNVCVLCKEQPAAVLCSECCKCYCERCSEFMHCLPKLKEHKTETLFECVKVNAMSPIHRNNALEMFCVDEVKLCCFGCKIEKLHESHNVVDLSEISEDNEIFSASDVKTRFADVLKCDDDLERKIEEVIDDIKSGSNVTKEKIKQTFIEAHDKLTEEEARILEELEKVCNESEEALQNNLKTLREVRDYGSALNEANSKMQNQSSRLMELNIVCEIEKQRKAMDELHRMKMTGLKIGWDNEKRKLLFTKALFNGAPIPSNISFTDISFKGIDFSWECDGSEVDEEKDKSRIDIKYTVEMKESNEEESGWKEVYSGKDNKCTVTGLEKDTEYNIRVKCVIGELQGMWSEVVSVKTKKGPDFSGCIWKKCPDYVYENRKYLVDDDNLRTATKIGYDGFYCTVMGDTPLSLNLITSWNIKILNSRNIYGNEIYIGVAPFDINQNESSNYGKCGWYFNCHETTLYSGLPHNYKGKKYGPRKKDGKYVHTGDIVGVAMNTLNGELSFVLSGVNYGVAFEGIPLNKPLVPCVILWCKNDSIELVI